MNKAYLHRELSRDTYLGHVDQVGKVYETRLGPDKLIGRVDPDTGKIYETRLGPDRYVGRLDGATGKLFRAEPGLDEYLGKIEADGALMLHKRLAPDQYIGRVADMYALPHAAAAFLLLVLPAYQEAHEKHDEADHGTADADKAA